MSGYWCRHAWLPGGVGHAVLIDTEGGWITGIAEGAAVPDGATVLDGLVVPGLANAHSHAFHRGLRGRTHHESGGSGVGSFWTWREQMYQLAMTLEPDTYRELATAVYAEMALAGITRVGEFHYVHHDPAGRPYAEPNAMGHALVDAARAAGLHITLLDTCYLSGGVQQPLAAQQQRFGDGNVQQWAARVKALADTYAHHDDVTVGAAVHSVRAVPADAIAVVAEWAAERRVPLHVHLSEQPAENDACMAAYGVTPTRLLADAGALGPGTTAVHATHLSAADIADLGSTGTSICMCPTTERDLADGIGPARRLADAGSPVCLGSDSHAVIDLFEEARAVELNERLATQRRGHWSPAELLEMATVSGHASLGAHGGGQLAVGAPADLVAVRTDSVRTAGSGVGPATVVFAASAADVTDVIVAGEPVVTAGRHRLGGVAGHLDRTITGLHAE